MIPKIAKRIPARKKKRRTRYLWKWGSNGAL
jgi:hypothetical protein